MAEIIDPWGGYKQSVARNDQLRQLDAYNSRADRQEKRQAGIDELNAILLRDKADETKRRRSTLADIDRIQRTDVKAPATTRMQDVFVPETTGDSEPGKEYGALTTQQQVDVPAVNYTPQEKAKMISDKLRSGGYMAEAHQMDEEQRVSAENMWKTTTNILKAFKGNVDKARPFLRANGIPEDVTNSLVGQSDDGRLIGEHKDASGKTVLYTYLNDDGTVEKHWAAAANAEETSYQDIGQTDKDSRFPLTLKSNHGCY